MSCRSSWPMGEGVDSAELVESSGFQCLPTNGSHSHSVSHSHNNYVHGPTRPHARRQTSTHMQCIPPTLCPLGSNAINHAITCCVCRLVSVSHGRPEWNGIGGQGDNQTTDTFPSGRSTTPTRPTSHRNTRRIHKLDQRLALAHRRDETRLGLMTNPRPFHPHHTSVCLSVFLSTCDEQLP